MQSWKLEKIGQETGLAVGVVKLLIAENSENAVELAYSRFLKLKPSIRNYKFWFRTVVAQKHFELELDKRLALEKESFKNMADKVEPEIAGLIKMLAKEKNIKPVEVQK